jgi:hypothetical protein
VRATMMAAFHCDTKRSAVHPKVRLTSMPIL